MGRTSAFLSSCYISDALMFWHNQLFILLLFFFYCKIVQARAELQKNGMTRRCTLVFRLLMLILEQFLQHNTDWP